MTRLKNVVFRDREIQGERLDLTDKGCLYFLSEHLVLRDCTVVLKVPAKNIIINKARFIHCTFDVRQELKNHQDWLFASLHGCRFKGRFSGCEFGHWPDYAQGAESGSVEDCDFTEAHLHGCRFHGCDLSTLRLPRWPCFTILDPLHTGQELLRKPWPGNLGTVPLVDPTQEPPSTVAVTWSASVLAQDSGTTTEALRAIVETCGSIFY